MQIFNPLVSIIIPIYNGSNYMKQAIDSALAQTYKNIEIIVINDGSTDNTEKIALSYGKKIKYFSKENGGVASALNLGIKKMKGEYFSWLSHDDEYLPQKIEKQIEYLKNLKNKDIILFSNYLFINDKSQDFMKPVIHNHALLIEKPIYSLYRGCINGITLLIPKKCFDLCGKFNSKLRCTQDYDMWLRMMGKFDFIHMEDVLTKTRLHGAQDTNKNPNVIIEGNDLWLKMIKKVTDDDKLKLEGSIFNFYYEMKKFLLNTPYDKAVQYCDEKCREIKLKAEKDINNIKVSVIIPFYNRLDMLEIAIRSVLLQTHKNIELLLINDGSDEDCSDLALKYKSHKHIKWIHIGKNLGPSNARNSGIKEATGDFIAFLDSDDYFLPNKIRTQLMWMLLSNSTISHTSYLRNDGKKQQIINSGLFNGDVIPKIIYNCPIATPTVMIKRDFLINNNINFYANLKIGEDICFWLEILKNKQLLGIDSALTVVNTNENSAAYNTNKQIIGIKNILKYVLSDDYYNKENYAIAKLCGNYQKLFYKSQGKKDVYFFDFDVPCPNCNKILKSNSWKITRPFRFIVKWIRTIKIHITKIIFRRKS
jgi:glycosyltransferase involved in cell wall biosynthesis